MKKRRLLWIMVLVLALAACPGALAEDMVSIAELHEQADAMGGVWQATFDTPNGEVMIDAPIMVPDIETLPVITLEGAKISEELFNQIIAGQKGEKAKADEFEYTIEIDGKTCEFFLGREENGLTGYEAADALWIQHGAYRFSEGVGLLDRAEPSSYHFGWTDDLNAPCLRGRELTLEDAMRLWNEDIDMCFPGEDFDVQLVVVTARGSLLTDKTGKSSEYKRDGYFIIEGKQAIGGVPILDGIVNPFGGSSFTNQYDKEYAKTAISKVERVRMPYSVGIAAAMKDMTMESRFATEEDYRTINTLARMRTVEIEDVPLASLDTLLDALTEEIEQGRLRKLYAVQLGYILYSNPDMTDHAWAIPRWVVTADYVPKGSEKDYDRQNKLNAKHGYDAPWETGYYDELLYDAQSGERIVFGIGGEEVFSVPEMKTWDALSEEG